MHDDSPRSRRDGRDDDPADSAFDALGLSALFDDATRENPVVSGSDDSPPAQQAPAFSWFSPEQEALRAPERPAPANDFVPPPQGAGQDTTVPAFADTIPSQPSTTSAFPWLAEEPPAVEAPSSQTPASFSWFETASPVAEDAPPTVAPEPGLRAPFDPPPTAAFDGSMPYSFGSEPATAFDDAATAVFGNAATTAFDSAPAAAFANTPTGAFGDAPTTPFDNMPTTAFAANRQDADGVGDRRGAADDSARRGGSGSGRRGGGSGRGGSGGGRRGGSGRGGSGDGPFAGILMLIRKNPRAWLIAAIAAGVVLLSGISFAIGAATSPAQALGAPSSTPSASATPTVKPTVRPTPSPAPAASKIRTCSVSSLAQDGRLGTLEAQVMNAKTGEVLFDRNGSTPAPTASVLKLLTAAAAFQALGPSYRVPTTVVKGSQPGQVVVIGGGDVTLSRLPSGQQSFYTNAPHLDDLANQVKQAWASDPANAGQPITSLVVDASLYSGPVWQPSWDENEERVVEGSTPYMTAFMADGDRNDPTAVESTRSTDPIGRAASALADDLGGGISVSQGPAPAGAKQLGQVLSQPVSALVEQALTYSDNTIMEELARLVAIKEGTGNSFSAINAGTTKALAAYGIPETGLYFADGSGLSGDNRVPPSYLTRFMVKVLDRQGSLGSIYDGLPIAGQTGTLGPGYDRFQGAASIAIGHVNAKTGWIDNGYTLSGVVHAQDGTDLTFAIFALGDVGSSAMDAIDQLTAGIYKCGNNLSNN